MSMFVNYDNLSPYYISDYIPDNSSLQNDGSNIVFDNSFPILVKNKLDKIVGYAFPEGTTVSLNTGLVLNVKVAADAIIYEAANEGPTIDTVGVLNQRAYNTLDCKSYVCKGKSLQENTSEDYIWEQDTQLVIPNEGEKEISFTPYRNYVKACVQIVNFRDEVVLKFNINCTDDMIHIDKDASNLLKQGVYRFEVYVTTITKRRQVLSHKLIVTGIDSRHHDIVSNVTALHNITEQATYIKGDVNSDGIVDDGDTVHLMRYISNWGNTIDKDNADINEDEVLDDTDYNLLIDYLNGTEVEEW